MNMIMVMCAQDDQCVSKLTKKTYLQNLIGCNRSVVVVVNRRDTRGGGGDVK